MRELRQPRTPSRGERGLSILEVLVSLTLFGIVMTATAAGFVAPYRAWVSGRNMINEQQNARVVLEWMSRRLRLAGLNTAAGTSEFFTSAEQTAVAFRADIDRNGSAEEHRFCLDTATGIVREQIGAAVSMTCTAGAPLTTPGDGRPLRVLLLDFEYYDGQERPLTPLPLPASQRPLVARVRIVLGLDSNLSGTYEAANDLTLTMDASVRNY
jgi:prepilin-type N-terminal cleavage/methylation domain-containing protein